MAQRQIPAGEGPDEARILPEKVWFDLWYVPAFPLERMGGRLDKDPAQAPWLLGLKADIEQEGRFRNPVVVWNHHDHRLTGKQPMWMLRAGSNRVWCAEQLGWPTVPAVVSTVKGETPPAPSFHRISPLTVQSYFPDGGRIWANEYGFGLLQAKRPEVTYAEYVPTISEIAQVKPTAHGRSLLAIHDDLA